MKLLEKLRERVEIIQMSLESFITKDSYDLVVCRHVLPFIENPLKQLERILSFGTITYFTLFGMDDERIKVSKVTKEQVEEVLQKFPNLEIRYQSESKFKGKLYNGDVIDWHLLTYITKKPL